MEADQARLDVATANLANAHVKNYHAQCFSAALTANGIDVTHQIAAGAPHGTDGAPFTDSTHEMVEVLQAQRNYETAQKTELSIDAVRTKEAQEVGRAAQ